MAFIVTPRQLAVRSELYHQVGSMLTAGITLPKVLDTLILNPPDRSLRPALRKVLQYIEQGYTFSEALRESGNWLTEFDIALLEAGERSGRLDACFKVLAIYYQGRAQLARSVLADLAYPLFVLHFAIFLWPLPDLVLKGDVTLYLAKTLGVLIPGYLGVFLLVLACQGRHGETWRGIIEDIGNVIPLLGKARRYLALARLSAALEALINAGISIINAWELAGAASGSPALRRRVMKWRPHLEHEARTPSEMLSEAREFPEMFSHLYHSGEVSGQLDGTLRRLYDYYHEEGTRKMRAIAQWLPRLVYLAIVFRIAQKIIAFYTGYFQGITDAL